MTDLRHLHRVLDPATAARQHGCEAQARFDGPPRHLDMRHSRADRLTRAFGIAAAVFALVCFGGQMVRGWLS